VVLLPGLLLRSLIPVGFMPMFGPGLSVGLMLCPAYAPLPVAISSPDGRVSKKSTAHASMDMSAMDMSMEMPMAAHEDQPADPSARRTDASRSKPTGASAASHGRVPGYGTDHPEHTLCPYAASATLAASPTCFTLTAREQLATEFELLTPQIAYFRLAPRAQSPRAPPLRPELTELAA
jgi:hypothetical protein